MYPWNSLTELIVQKKDKNTVIISLLTDMKRIIVNFFFFLAADAEVFLFHNYSERATYLFDIFLSTLQSFSCVSSFKLPHLT